MSGYWTNFTRAAIRTAHGLPRWPTFGGDGNVLHLGESVFVEGVPARASLQVFDAVYDAVRGKPFGAQKSGAP